MSIRVRCAACARQFNVPEKHAGHAMDCPKCGAEMPIPPSTVPPQAVVEKQPAPQSAGGPSPKPPVAQPLPAKSRKPPMPKAVEQASLPTAPAADIPTATPLAADPAPALPPVAQAMPAAAAAPQSDVPLIDTGSSHTSGGTPDHAFHGSPAERSKKPIGMLVGLLIAAGVAVPAAIAVVAMMLWTPTEDEPVEDPLNPVVQVTGDVTADSPVDSDEARILMEWPEQERTNGRIYIDNRSYTVSASGPLEFPLKPGEYRIGLTRTVDEAEVRYDVQLTLEGGTTTVVRPDWDAARPVSDPTVATTTGGLGDAIPIPTVDDDTPFPTVDETVPRPTVDDPTPRPLVDDPEPRPTVDDTASHPTVDFPTPRPAVDDPAPRPTGEESPIPAIVQFVTLLRADGIEVSSLKPGGVPIVAEPGVIVESDGQRIYVFDGKTAGQAQAEKERIAAAADTDESQAWPNPVHAYQQDRWIVVYPGSEPSLLDKLAGCVGAPFASLPRNEPPVPEEGQHLLVGKEATLFLWEGKPIEQAQIAEVDAEGKAFRSILISQGERKRPRRLQAKALGRIVIEDRPYRVDPKPDAPGLYVLFDIQAHRDEVDRYLRSKGQRLWPEPTPEEQVAAVAEHKAFLEKVGKTFPGMWLHETDYFLFFTDIPPARVGPFAVSLDEMYRRLCQVFGVAGGQNIWRGKAVVIAFTRKESFIQFEASFMNNTDAAGAAGLHHGSSNGNVVISCYLLSDPTAFGHMLVHETAHGFLHRYYSTVHVASWINEGIAEWVGHAVVPRCKQVPLKQAAAKHQLKQTRTLGGMFFKERGNIDGWQYGVASEMTNMMVSADPRRYGAFVNAIKEGKTVEESLRECYGCTPGQLVQAYGRKIGVPDLRP